MAPSVLDGATQFPAPVPRPLQTLVPEQPYISPQAAAPQVSVEPLHFPHIVLPPQELVLLAAVQVAGLPVKQEVVPE